MNEPVRHLHSAGRFVSGRNADRHAVTVREGGPTCFVLDREPGVRRLVSAVVSDLGVRADQFDSLPLLLDAVSRHAPDVIFLDIGSDGADCIEALQVAQVGCPVQLMSGLNAVLVEEIRRSGERHGLKMLPVLQKPFRHNAVRQVLQGLGLRRDVLSKVSVTLAEAIRQDWLELWYQPKIDLRAKLLAGAEGYVRVNHPSHGILPPDSFLADAGEAELLTLTEHVISTVLRDWAVFARFGIPVRFAINVPQAALVRLPLAAIFRDARPKAGNWPGLVLEITEDEIIPDLSLAHAMAKELRPYNVSLAVDDFGAAYGSLARLRELPFSEIKIDRSFVGSCDTEPMNAGLCETVIELAHRFNVLCVAEGIETPGELKALHRMGCDLGQGYLFARPMPKEQFAALLRERGRSKSAR